MEHHEQIDAFTFKIINLAQEAQPKLDGTHNDEVLGDFITALNATVARYLDEFDINMYEIVGILESIKLDLMLDEEMIAPEIIGCIEAKKSGILIDTDVTFEMEEDDDDDDILPFDPEVYG